MSKNKFNDDFFANVCEKEAWKRLSSSDNEFRWSERLIDRCRDKIDWKELSQNRNVQWNASMIERFGSYLFDWNALSSSDCQALYSIENLRKFKSKWVWSKLSSNRDVNWTMDKIEEFKDLIDWDKIINLHYTHGLYTLEFFEKFKDYISGSSFQNSNLWEEIMKIYTDKLAEKLLAL